MIFLSSAIKIWGKMISFSAKQKALLKNDDLFERHRIRTDDLYKVQIYHLKELARQLPWRIFDCF